MLFRSDELIELGTDLPFRLFGSTGGAASVHGKHSSWAPALVAAADPERRRRVKESRELGDRESQCSWDLCGGLEGESMELSFPTCQTFHRRHSSPDPVRGVLARPMVQSGSWGSNPRAGASVPSAGAGLPTEQNYFGCTSYLFFLTPRSF